MGDHLPPHTADPLDGRGRISPIPRPVTWHPALEEPDAFYCPRCWRDFAAGEIDADQLLRTIIHPMRLRTSWACSVCTEVGYGYDDEPLPHERTDALAHIRDHIGWWAVEHGIITRDELVKRQDEDDF